MLVRVNRLVVATALALSGTAALAAIAAAAPGPGTFTRITTPGKAITIRWTGADKHIMVSGRASPHHAIPLPRSRVAISDVRCSATKKLLSTNSTALML